MTSHWRYKMFFLKRRLMHFSLLSSNFRFSKDVFLEKLINHLKDANRYVIKKNCRLSHESTIVREIDVFGLKNVFFLWSLLVCKIQSIWNTSRLSNCWPGIGYNFSDKHIQSQERKIDFNGKREAAALMRFLTQQDSKNSGFQTCHSSQFRFVGLVICPPPFFGGSPLFPYLHGFFLNTPHIVTITHKSHDWSSIRGK